MAQQQNPFIWHDLMITDVAAAKTFYGAAKGTVMNKGEMGSYVLFQIAGQNIRPATRQFSTCQRNEVRRA